MSVTDILKSLDPLSTVTNLVGDVVHGLLGDNALSDAITGAAKIGAGVATGDVIVGLDGAKDLLGAASQLPQPVVEFAACLLFPPLAIPFAIAKLTQGYAKAAGEFAGPQGDWDRQLAGAVDALQNHFDLIDTAAGIGPRDGIIARCDLEAALANPAVPADVKSACRFLLANSAAFNQLDVGAGIGEVDGFLSRADIDAVAARIQKPSRDLGDAPSLGSSTTRPHGGSRFSGMSAEEIVQALMLGALDDLDDSLVDKAQALEKAQTKLANAEKGSKDEKTANKDANRLQFELQQLMEKRRQMFDLASNFSRINHEMAKTAIGNLGRV